MRFTEGSVRQALNDLSDKGRLAFALSCAERLWPNYLAFKREAGWGDPVALRRALDLAWASLDGAEPSASSIALARKQVREAEPETEDFDTILVSSALDAAASAGLVLQVLEAADPAAVVEIASLCRDTVAMFVQDREHIAAAAANLEDQIYDHRLMQAEMQRQHDDLAELASFSGTQREVAELRAKWRTPEKGSIDGPG